MNSQTQSENSVKDSSATLDSWPTQPQEAMLLLTLMERYHQVAQVFKALRDHWSAKLKDLPCMDHGEVEAHRVVATALFNQMYVLLNERLIAPSLFALVISPGAARLWLELVAPLDREIRNAGRVRQGLPVEEGEHPIEQFYRYYAETGMLKVRVRDQDAAPLLNMPTSGKH